MKLFEIFQFAARSAFFRSFAGMVAVLCLVFAATSCKDDDSDNLIAGVASESFTFNESEPDKNTVEVFANTPWKVYWIPESANVKVTPESGPTIGSFRIVDMPRSSTIQIGVRATMGGRSGKTITVKRYGTDVLVLAPTALLFDPANPEGNVVTVTSNTSWSVSASNEAVKFTPASGKNNGKITITEVPAGDTYELTVRTGSGPSAMVKKVELRRIP